VLGTPGEGGSAARVRRGGQQAAEHREVLQEVDPLLHPVGVLLGLPEAVPGRGGGHQRRGQRERGQPREPAKRQQRARHHLDGAVEPDRVLGLGRDGREPVGQRADHRLGSRRHLLWVAEGVEALDDEDGRHHGPGESSYYGHDPLLPTGGRCNLPEPRGRNNVPRRSPGADVIVPS